MTDEGSRMETRADIPYGLIAMQWSRKKVVPFLGAAASVVGMDPGRKAILDVRGFTSLLVGDSGYPGETSDPLSKVAQYAEDWVGGRPAVLEYVSREFNEVFDDPASGIVSPYECALTRFLESIPAALPRLILTTNYDTILERVFEQPSFKDRGIRYVAVSHVLSGNEKFGQLLCYDSLAVPAANMTPSEFNEHIQPGARYAGAIVIYKMNGTSQHTGQAGIDDSIVLTEFDYVNFMSNDLLSLIPATIIDWLRTSHLLFLGYSLEDWNFRALLQNYITPKLQSQRCPHWACRLFDENSPSGLVEKKFWDKRNVNLYNVDLGAFLKTLGSAIGSTR